MHTIVREDVVATSAARGRRAPAPAGTVELSIVIPAHNEIDNLEPLLDELRAALAAAGRSHEILLIDDGSSDGTTQRVTELARREAGVRGLLLPRRMGQSAALAAGIARARGDVIVTLDADLQNDPADLPRVLAALETADVVSGIRTQRHDSWLRRVSSRIANTTRRALLGDTVTDIGCSFKAYRRETLEGVPMFDGVHRFLPALCAFRGAKLAEVQLTHRPRRHGRSKYGVKNRLWRGLHDVIGVQWLKTRLMKVHVREVDR